MQEFDISQQPSPDGTNAPQSGAYGQKAAVDKLKAAMPPLPPDQGQGGAPSVSAAPVTPQPTGRINEGGRSAVPPPGIPSSIMGDTALPQTPVNTPLSAPVDPMSGATADERTVMQLQSVLQSGNVRPETKEWAQNLLDMILRND
jgi:hypothetical protein